MVPELPNDLALHVFDFAVVDNDLAVAKALRLVNRECALRFARPVWFVGARTHYFNYLIRLGHLERYHTVKLLCNAHPRGMECIHFLLVLARLDVLQGRHPILFVPL